jgi:hypothetical protein
VLTPAQITNSAPIKTRLRELGMSNVSLAVDFHGGPARLAATSVTIISWCAALVIDTRWCPFSAKRSRSPDTPR